MSPPLPVNPSTGRLTTSGAVSSIFYMDECSTKGLSVVALDARDGGTVVGAIICREFLSPPDPRVIEYVEEPSPFAPLAKAVEMLDAAWFLTHPEIDRNETGRVADLWMGGVSPAYRGRGIASRLGRLALERLTLAGFEFAIGECTGAFSQNTMAAAGFTAVYELAYADFLWKGRAIFKHVEKPHSKWVIYEKKLNPASHSKGFPALGTK